MFSNLLIEFFVAIFLFIFAWIICGRINLICRWIDLIAILIINLLFINLFIIFCCLFNFRRLFFFDIFFVRSTLLLLLNLWAFTVSTHTIIELFFVLFDINIKYITVLFIIFKPLDNILTMSTVDAEWIRISIFLTITWSFVLIELHYLFMQLMVKLLRDFWVFIIQVMLNDKLTNKIGASWYLAFSTSHKEFKNMLVGLLVLVTIALKHHEVAN